MITINCLGGFYGGHIQAYPCLGFSQLNNDGLVGGCEADILSAFTMLAMGYLTGRPGFISDPVIDTVDEPDHLRPLRGADQGLRPRWNGQRLPHPHAFGGPQGGGHPIAAAAGYLLTTMKFNPAKREVVLHQAKAVGNVDDDRACRTKLAAEVHGDIEKLMNHWSVGTSRGTA